MDVRLRRPATVSLDSLLGILGLGLFGYGAFLVFTEVGSAQGATGWAMLAVGLILVVPRVLLKLTLSPAGLRVGVVTGHRTFPLDALGEADVLEGILLIRLLGVSTAGYHTGYFYVRGLGRCKAYTSTLKG
ncbi:MAG: hypothetical protein R3185_06245, partial [Candidatus Thermoplasmatota archaeon]|nr:hypothetical protein [Candidatus Thermoplasmatota archaeon]